MCSDYSCVLQALHVTCYGPYVTYHCSRLKKLTELHRLGHNQNINKKNPKNAETIFKIYFLARHCWQKAIKT